MLSLALALEAVGVELLGIGTTDSELHADVVLESGPSLDLSMDGRVGEVGREVAPTGEGSTDN